MRNPQTVVAVYDTFEHADRATQALVESGFPRTDIGLLANDSRGDYSRYAPAEDVSGGDGGSFGAIIGGLTGAMLGLTAIIIPGVGPVIAAGPLMALLGGTAGAVVGGAAGAVTGSIAASLIHLGVPDSEADYYAESVRRGNTLVTVTVDNDEDAETVSNVMQRYDPVDVKRRAEAWRERGWHGFDPTSDPYTQEELIREREQHPSTSEIASDTDAIKRYYPSIRP